MANITSLVLLFLTVAAASIPAPAGAAGAGAFAAVFSKAALKRTADFFQKSSKKLMKPIDIGKDIALEYISQTTDDGQLLPRGNDAAAGWATVFGPVGVVQAGGVSFSVGGVDVTSRVTWTSRCGGGSSSQQVACGDPLCEQYGACDGGDASSAAGRVCNSVAPAGVPLREGKIALLLGAKGSMGSQIFSKDNAAYACRPNAAAGGNDYAVIGLGRGNDIIANFTTKLFSYTIDGDLQGSTVWLDYNVTRSRTAGQAGSRTTRLRSVGSNSSLYYVGITGIKVGSGEVGSEEVTADGILTTTMPITFLKPSLFDHLKQELNKAVASLAVNGSGIDARFRQLCYPSGTKLPAITLLFVGQNAGMELRPEHYSYEESSGVVCLSILPSPLSFGLSIIGSMVQAGRRMTYDLDDNTLTFDASASAFASSSQSQSPSPPSSSSVAQAALTPLFLSPAFAVLLIAIIL